MPNLVNQHYLVNIVSSLYNKIPSKAHLDMWRENIFVSTYGEEIWNVNANSVFTKMMRQLPMNRNNKPSVFEQIFCGFKYVCFGVCKGLLGLWLLK